MIWDLKLDMKILANYQTHAHHYERRLLVARLQACLDKIYERFVYHRPPNEMLTNQIIKQLVCEFLVRKICEI